MRKRIFLGLAALSAVVLTFLFYFESHLGVPETESKSIPASGRTSKAEVQPKLRDVRPHAKRIRGFVPPWHKEGGKRAPEIDSSQLAWLAEGWRLVDEGEFVAARRKFQSLINEHGGEPGIPYAFLAISEVFALEGGEENLWAAYDGFRDFLVFYPDHDLAAHANARVVELRQMLPAKRTLGKQR